MFELTAGGSKVHAGCNEKIVSRYTPWLDAHTTKCPVRPLGHALQDLDPRIIGRQVKKKRKSLLLYFFEMEKNNIIETN